MVNIDDIDKTILELESKDTTYAVCERLAWLYIVRDHISGNKLTKTATYSNASEFLEIATTCDIDRFLAVMDEHMNCVKTMYPKEYHAVIERLIENNRSAEICTPFYGMCKSNSADA